MILEIKVTVPNAQVVRQGLEDFTQVACPKIGRRRLYNTAVFIRSRVTRAPGRWTGHWKALTPAQNRYVHFLYSYKKGVLATRPYTRTGSYVGSWKIIKTPEGYTVTAGGYWLAGTGMRVGAPYLEYVGGDLEGSTQSFMHVGRWPLIYNILEQARANAPWQIMSEIASEAKMRGYKWED